MKEKYKKNKINVSNTWRNLKIILNFKIAEIYFTFELKLLKKRSGIIQAWLTKQILTRGCAAWLIKIKYVRVDDRWPD